MKSGASIMQRGGREVHPRCSRSRVVTFPRSTRPYLRLYPPSVRCKSIRHAAKRYVYCRCIEKQNAPSPTLRKYRGFHNDARVGGWRDETRNPLVVDFSECLRINRLTVLVDFYKGEREWLLFLKQKMTFNFYEN